MTIVDMNEAIRNNNLLSPEGNELSAVETFNMMFKTVSGSKYASIDGEKTKSLSGTINLHNNDGTTGKYEINDHGDELSGFMLYDKNSVSYMRPETAQGMFVNFKNI